MPQQLYSSSDDEEHQGSTRQGSIRRCRYRENVKRRSLRVRKSIEVQEIEKIELIKHTSDSSTSETQEQAKEHQNGNANMEEGADKPGNQNNGDPVKPKIQEGPKTQTTSSQAQNGTSQHQNGANQHQNRFGLPYNSGSTSQFNLGAIPPFAYLPSMPYIQPVYYMPTYLTPTGSPASNSIPQRRTGIPAPHFVPTYQALPGSQPTFSSPSVRQENLRYGINCPQRTAIYYPMDNSACQTTFPSSPSYQTPGNFQATYGANASHRPIYTRPSNITPPPPYESFFPGLENNQRPGTPQAPGFQGNAQQAPDARRNPTQASNPGGDAQQTSGPRRNPTQTYQTRIFTPSAAATRQNPTEASIHQTLREARRILAQFAANQPPQRAPTPPRAFGPLNQHQSEHELQRTFEQGYVSTARNLDAKRNFENIAESSASSSD